MKRSVLTTVLITVLAVAALGAMAFGVYQIGFQAGLVDSGAEVVVNRVHDGLRAVGWGGWGFGFGFFGLIFRILFFVLIFGLIARLVFGPRRWGWGPGPYWGGYQGPNHPMEERLTEWHDKAHRGPEQSDPGPAQRE
jgi:hypothetical protein